MPTNRASASTTGKQLMRRVSIAAIATDNEVSGRTVTGSFFMTSATTDESRWGLRIAKRSRSDQK